MGKDETVFPDHKFIVQAVRKMWHESTMPPIVMASDWFRLMSGDKVAASAVATDPMWPLLELPRTEEIEGSQGKQPFLAAIAALYLGSSLTD